MSLQQDRAPAGSTKQKQKRMTDGHGDVPLFVELGGLSVAG
jgi:hypothetical protein